jgi:hypothetical protein
LDATTSVGPARDFYVRDLLNLFFLKFSWSPQYPTPERHPQHISWEFERILLIGSTIVQL